MGLLTWLFLQAIISSLWMIFIPLHNLSILWAYIFIPIVHLIQSYLILTSLSNSSVSSNTLDSPPPSSSAVYLFSLIGSILIHNTFGHSRTGIVKIILTFPLLIHLLITKHWTFFSFLYLTLFYFHIYLITLSTPYYSGFSLEQLNN